MTTSRAETTRERLIGATERLICGGGLSAVTTQNVARECGFAEGTIYRHFESREDLVLTVLRERLPGEFQPAVDALVQGAGEGDLNQGLATFLASVLPIFSIMSPAAGMLAADPALARRNAEALRADGKSPSHLLSQVASYFREEQRLGRISRDVNPNAAAGLMIGFCFYRSLMQHLFGEDPTGLSDADLPSAIASILARGVDAGAAAKARPEATRHESKKTSRGASAPSAATSRTAKLKRG